MALTLSLIDIFQMLTDKLGEIHDRSIVHCDLKAVNIIINRNPDNSLKNVHIIDFGLARVIGETLKFSNPVEARQEDCYAPELFIGKPVSPVTDFYPSVILLESVIEGMSDVPKPLEILADKLMTWITGQRGALLFITP